MNVVKCDICGKELARWYRISISPAAIHDETNISHMISNSGTKDVCEKCIEDLSAKWSELKNEYCKNKSDRAQ